MSLELDNDLTYGRNVWLAGVLIVPILWGFYLMLKIDPSENYLMLFLKILFVPIGVFVISIPFHLIFLLINKLIFRSVYTIKRAKVWIFLSAMIIGIFQLLFLLRIEDISIDFSYKKRTE